MTRSPPAAGNRSGAANATAATIQAALTLCPTRQDREHDKAAGFSIVDS